MKLKYRDHFTVLMIGFIFFLFLLFLYLFKIDNDIKHYDKYHDWIIQLKIVDKEFDNFLLQKLSFIDYDKITKCTDDFETTLLLIGNSNLNTEFGMDFNENLKNIKSLFEDKLEVIEYFKSNNATTITSIHYLFDLHKRINEDQNIPSETNKLTQEILFSLLQLLVNVETTPKSIIQKLTILNQEDEHPYKVISNFLNHSNLILKNIMKFKDIQEEAKNIKLNESIDNFHKKLDNIHKEHLFSQKIIILFAFISAFIIVLTLIIVYRRSTKVKQELMAFRFAVEHSDNSIVMTDANKNIVYVNDVFERDSGYTYDEAVGKNPRILKSNMIEQSYYNDLNDTLRRGEKWEGEFINKRKDGSLFHEKASIVPIFINNVLVNYLAIKLDISEYIEQQKQMDHMAYHDALTNLPNRIYFEERLKHILDVSNRTENMIAVLFIDLDRFKIINDTLGHHIGDEMLKTISERIKSVVRSSDTVARMGGDEFVVIIETMKTKNEAAVVSRNIIKAVREPILIQSHTLNTTASIGIALFPNDGKNINTIIKHADSAMYQAKKLGKNRYHYYIKSLSENFHLRLKREQYLHNAIKNGELTVLYQPQYNLKNQKVIGIESLLRWQNEALGVVSPNDFIPIAEETGLIIEIGKYVFKEACKTFLELKSTGINIETIAINVSNIQFRQNNFLKQIKSIIDDLKIDAHHIEIEITEGYMMEYTKSNLTILDDIRELGIKISIDDFGTGYSSMSYLKRLPIDTIKIDKSFIDEIAYENNDFEITKAIIALSHSLGYSTVAEGIETKKQEKILLELTCDIGQGYHFARPLKKSDLINFMKDKQNES